MKIEKRVLCPERVRRVPAHFSWIDHQLVRDGSYFKECDHRALALYLVLVTVGDAEGLSYYSDQSLERMLRLDRAQLLAARQQLCQAGLIVYEQPLYQVLSLPPAASSAAPDPRSGQTRSAREIFRAMLGGQP